MKKLKFVWFSLVIVFSFVIFNEAAADAAPPPPPAGSDIYPSIGDTKVRMMSEYVVIDVLSYSDNPLGEAKVTAQFFMKNLGEETEEMKVRFPMFHTGYMLNHETTYKEEWCEVDEMTPEPLKEISVWVNGVQITNEISYKEFIFREWIEDEEEYVDVANTIPCWSHFDVTFPPNETVEIKVSYTVSGFPPKRNPQTIRFPYVLKTGAGWFGTIGKATIIARLPYEVSDQNFIRCYPENCLIQGNEIIWQYEDFIPDEDIDFSIIKPSMWIKVLEERGNVEKNPNDGEAWGRLGKAYKELMRYWDLILPDHEVFTELSLEAYENAIKLLPNDADWHFGYAELLCFYARFGPTDQPSIEDCIAEIKTTLDIDPDHELTWNFFSTLEAIGFIPKYISMEGDTPIYKALTPKPPTSTPGTPAATSTKWPSNTSRPTNTALPTASATIEPSNTASPTDQPTATAILEPVVEEGDGGSSAVLFVGAGGLIFLLVGLGLYARRKQ